MTDTGPAPSARGNDFRIGGVIGSGFSIFRDNLLHFLVLGIVLFAPPLLIFVVLGGASLLALSPNAPLGSDPGDPFGVSGLIFLIPTLLLIVAYLLFIAAATFSTVEALRGRNPSVSNSLTRSFNHAIPLLLLTVLVVVVFLIVMMVYGGVVAALAAVGGGAFAIVGVVGGIALSLWVYVLISAAIPALVMERAGVIGCLTRSMRLTKGHRWKIFGVFLLLFIIFFVAGFIVSAIVGALAFVVGASLFAILSGLLQILVQLVTFVLSAIFIAVIYYQLRRTKEGIGVEDIAAVFD